MSVEHQKDGLALKLPPTTDKHGLRYFISIVSFSKLDKNKSNSSLLWLGKQ